MHTHSCYRKARATAKKLTRGEGITPASHNAPPESLLTPRVTVTGKSCYSQGPTCHIHPRLGTQVLKSPPGPGTRMLMSPLDRGPTCQCPLPSPPTGGLRVHLPLIPGTHVPICPPSQEPACSCPPWMRGPHRYIPTGPRTHLPTSPCSSTDYFCVAFLAMAL